MDISQYLSLSYLYKLLKSNAVSAGIVGFSLLFIFQMNLATFTLVLILLFAVPFSVYFLFVLYLHGKMGWVYGFLIGLIISFLPFLFFSDGNIFLIVLKFSPLLFFILYNVSLKIKVGELLIDQKFNNDETFSGC